MMFKKRGLFLVVLALFLALSLSQLTLAETEGCYIFPKASEDVFCIAGTLQSDAQADCDKYSDCNLDAYFIPGSDCSSFSQCDQVICNVDCQTHALGKCEQLAKEDGKTAVGISTQDPNYSGLFDYWCKYTNGCCQLIKSTGEDSCFSGINQYECNLRADQLLISSTENILFHGSITSQGACQAKCNVEISTSTLKVQVADAISNSKISGAKVWLEAQQKETTTDSSGMASFPNLIPKNYLVKVTKEGYAAGSAAISLEPGVTYQFNLTLSPLGEAFTLGGKVVDNNNGAIEGAMIVWEDPKNPASKGTTYTNNLGVYSFSDLPKKELTFTASKKGYEFSKKTQNLIANVQNFNFVLKKSSTTGVSGIVYLDLNGNLKKDASDLAVYDAKIYVDGIFRGYSQYPDGKYEINLVVASTSSANKHNLTATYQDYQMEPLTIQISGGVLLNQDLLLSKFVGECSENGASPQKNVEEFLASPVLGKEQVQLNWQKPCAEVVGYKIEKYLGETYLGQLSGSPAENLFLDEDVKWGETYTYKIKAQYISGLESETAAEQTITMGDESCQDRYHEIGGWETFCIGGAKELRKTVWTCDENNKLITSLNCAEQDGVGEDYYCARTGLTEASCKDAGICGAFADPFGLYHQKEACYGNTIAGGLASNFCYYDYTDTVVDQCRSCTQISTCFDYKSKDACTINSCLGDICEWIDGASNSNPLIDYSLVFSGINIPTLVTAETGSGYCVKKDYTKDDRCSLCGPTAGLFEDAYCTAQICSGLGNCFSSQKLESCQACGEVPTEDANCYAYNTEYECVGSSGLDEGLQKNSLSKISLSKDRCSWGRCVWIGTSGGAGKCIKDGDGDDADDCAGFSSSGELSACAKDVSAPQTKILPEGINVVSLAYPNITFWASENQHKFANQKNKLRSLSYCVTPADVNAPDECQTINGKNPFKEINFPGKLTEETLVVNLINSSFTGKSINGQTYRIKYYSKDKYFNQENLQESIIFVDNVVPTFEINYSIDTQQDITDLTIVLKKTEEPMDCTFNLYQIVPAGSSQTKTVTKDVYKKEVLFENLNGVKYKLNVSCVDEQGNVNVQTKDFAFDLEQGIILTYPKPYQVIKDTFIEFQAETIVGSTCSLYLSNTNEKIASFITDEVGKSHKTEPLSLYELGLKTGIPPEADHSEFEIYCTEMYTAAEIPREMSEFYIFSVDLTAPNTQIVLTEGLREEKPSTYDWSLNFIRSAQVSFECNDTQGFSCEAQYYCLGKGCDLIDSPDYKQYSSTFVVENTTEICYYSTDTGNNTFYQLICGTIVIDGYGITLQKPELYYYENEMWGISSAPIFEWQFFTKVPSQECAMDFTSEFDYASIPAQNIRSSNGDNTYTYVDFPESVFSAYDEDGETKEVYVQCKNGEGEISPEQKMYLEYDPSAPEIIDAYADPELLFEGITTALYADTDDKTICKFSDNSYGDGATDFELMNYIFPAGDDQNILSYNHSLVFTTGAVGEDGKRNYSLLVVCKNGAGLFSENQPIDFLVDYSTLGYILPESISPQGYIDGKDVLLELSSSKNALCQVKLDNLTYTDMQTDDSRNHYYTLGTLVDEEYKLPIKCRMGDHYAEDAFEFTVDTKPPIINEIETGNYTCGSDSMSVMVRTNETALKEYYFELYDKGTFSTSGTPSASTLTSNVNGSSTSSTKTNTTKTNTNTTASSSTNSSSSSSTPTSSSSSTNQMVLNGTVGLSLPFDIEYDFNESHKYTFKIRAVDAAGNVGQFKESNVFFAVAKNYSLCKKDKSAPKLSVYLNTSSCDKVLAEISCYDETSCKTVKYGKSASATTCSPNSTYLGEKITFDKSGWLCYYAEDVTGHNITDSQPITLTDKDSDGVVDSCDKCASTGAGKIVDETGCASSEPETKTKNTDLDKDGLPDDWEKENDADDCLFDFTNDDSDSNGISDSLDDYDEDGSTNHQEYVSGSNPCVADKFTEETKVEKETFTPVVTPTSQPNLIAWIVLIIGILLFLGGSGYLYYYYKSKPDYSRGYRPTPAQLTQAAGVRRAPGQPADWKNKLFGLQRRKQEQNKQRTRESVFGSFSQESKEIPHVDKIISSRISSTATVLPKIQQVAQTYVQHKEEINPGLKPEEKALFSKLESIANKTKDKKIHQVVSKEEAGDIFAKLKNISKKRKS